MDWPNDIEFSSHPKEVVTSGNLDLGEVWEDQNVTPDDVFTPPEVPMAQKRTYVEETSKQDEFHVEPKKKRVSEVVDRRPELPEVPEAEEEVTIDAVSVGQAVIEELIAFSIDDNHLKRILQIKLRGPLKKHLRLPLPFHLLSPDGQDMFYRLHLWMSQTPQFRLESLQMEPSEVVSMLGLQQLREKDLKQKTEVKVAHKIYQQKIQNVPQAAYQQELEENHYPPAILEHCQFENVPLDHQYHQTDIPHQFKNGEVHVNDFNDQESSEESQWNQNGSNSVDYDQDNQYQQKDHLNQIENVPPTMNSENNYHWQPEDSQSYQENYQQSLEVVSNELDYVPVESENYQYPQTEHQLEDGSIDTDYQEEMRSHQYQQTDNQLNVYQDDTAPNYNQNLQTDQVEHQYETDPNELNQQTDYSLQHVSTDSQDSYEQSNVSEEQGFEDAQNGTDDQSNYQHVPIDVGEPENYEYFQTTDDYLNCHSPPMNYNVYLQQDHPQIDLTQEEEEIPEEFDPFFLREALLFDIKTYSIPIEAIANQVVKTTSDSLQELLKSPEPFGDLSGLHKDQLKCIHKWMCLKFKGRIGKLKLAPTEVVRVFWKFFTTNEEFEDAEELEMAKRVRFVSKQIEIQELNHHIEINYDKFEILLKTERLNCPLPSKMLIKLLLERCKFNYYPHLKWFKMPNTRREHIMRWILWLFHPKQTVIEMVLKSVTSTDLANYLSVRPPLNFLAEKSANRKYNVVMELLYKYEIPSIPDEIEPIDCFSMAPIALNMFKSLNVGLSPFAEILDVFSWSKLNGILRSPKEWPKTKPANKILFWKINQLMIYLKKKLSPELFGTF